MGEGDVNIGGTRIKYIRFADDMALLAEDERCEDYGMKININKTKGMVFGRKPKKIDIRIKGESMNKWTASNTWGVILVVT